MRIVMWIAVACLVVGGVKWLGEGNNGHDAGQTAGNAAHTGVRGVGGAFDAANGFFKGLTK